MSSKPDIAGQNLANPSSLILSAKMLLRYIGWFEAADAILNGMEGAIARMLTGDLARITHGATRVSCSQFGEEIIRHM